MQECVVNEIKSQGIVERSDEIFGMIERLEHQDQDHYTENLDSDDEDENDANGLDCRIAGINLDDADAIWEKLNEQERQELKSLLYNNECHDMIERITPWWCNQMNTQLIRDEEMFQSEIENILKSCPEFAKNIADFENLTKTNPHSCIIFNCCNIVTAYVYLFRYFNGDCHSYVNEFTDSLIEICDNLKKDTNFLDENISSVVESVILNCANNGLPTDSNTHFILIDDLKKIINGPILDMGAQRERDFLLSALSDCLNLIETAYNQNQERKSVKKNDQKAKSRFLSEFANTNAKLNYYHSKKIIKKNVKKIEYLLSFVKHKYSSAVYQINWTSNN